MKLTLKINDNVTHFDITCPCVINQNDDEIVISEVPHMYHNQPDVDIMCEGIPVRLLRQYFEVAMKEDARTSPIIEKIRKLLDEVESIRAKCARMPVTSITSDYLEAVLKKACNKPIVKQVRALLKDDISDTRFNSILAGMKAAMEARNSKDVDVAVADVLLCTAMFVAAGYSYLDALRLIREHDVKPVPLGSEVIDGDWYRWIIAGKCGFEPLSRAIGTVK